MEFSKLAALLLTLAPLLFQITNGSVEFLETAKESKFMGWMVGIRRRLHENPELGYEEFMTSELIRKELDSMGIRYNYPFAVTGIVGFVGTGEAPFVALRADMDALPIQESVEWEHKSKIDGKMHACGHDAHVAMLLGAAKILQERTNDIKGTVVLIFQPAEEGGGGSKKMIDQNALPTNIESIFGFHVSTDLPIGSFGARPGPIMAGSGFFEAVINGKGGHAAIPQHTIDPIIAASNVIVSLQHLVSREADPLDSQVVTVAKFQGGGAFNVIPDSVTIGGTFRAFSKQSFSQLKQRIEEVIVRQASVQRCNATVDFLTDSKPFFPPTINSKSLHNFFLKTAADVAGPTAVRDIQPTMGAEDFSFFNEVVPNSYYYFVGMVDESASGPRFRGHNPFFTVNEDAMAYGASMHASLAFEYLNGFVGKEGDGKVKSDSHDEL
ncbi:hypothetical protein LUZ60_008604 [Juncus effusus]|nr:hypothetical protein LUZ60_008604 [Juncus effusus]